jgi:drug/metabolite transporter (DMT)-like permease
MVALVYTACALIWGTTWFAIRRCIGPGGYPTIAGAAIRFVIAAALLALVAALGGARPGPRGKREISVLVLAGVFGAVSYALVYSAEESVSGGVAAVIFGTLPLWTAVVATVGGVERVTRGQIAGSVIALMGVAVVFADRLDASRAQGIAILLLLTSVATSALYSTMLKQVASSVHPLATTGVFLGTTGVILAVWAGAIERRPVPWPPPVGPSLALLYLALVGSVVVFTGFFYLMKRVRLMTLSMLVLFEPIVAMVVDALWEKDVVLVARSYVGMAVVIAGVAVSLFVQRVRVEV